MSEIINIADIQINYGEAEKRSVELLASIQNLKKEMADAKKNGGELTSEYINQEAELKNLQQEYKGHTATLKNIKTVQDDATGSIVRMQAENAILRQEQRQLNLTTEEGIKRNKEIVAAINKNTEAISGNSDEQLKGYQQIGQYHKGLNELKVSLLSSIPGFDSASKAVRGFGVASKVALGVIGLVSAAVAGLVAIFKTFVPVIDRTKQGMAALKAVFTVVQDAVVSLVTGAKSLTNVFSGMGKAMGDAAKEAVALTKAQQSLDDQIKQQAVNDARYSKQINELILQSKDLTKSEGERAALIEKALEIETKAFQEKKKIADEELRIAQQKIINGRNLTAEQIKAVKEGNLIALGDLQDKKAITDEEIDKLKDALIKKEEIENQSITIREKALNRQNAIIERAAAEQEKREEKARAAREKAAEERAKAEEKRLAEEEKAKAERERLAQEEVERKLALMDYELEKYKLLNKSNIESDEELTAESVINEQMRLESISQMQSDYNLQQLEAKKITAEQYDLLELQRVQQLETDKNAIVLRYNDQLDAIKKERLIINAENEKALAEQSIFSKLELDRKYLDEKYQLELDAAEKVGADVSMIEKKYANAKKAIAREEMNAKLSLAAQFANNIATIAGEGTEIAKAAGAAATTISTFQAAQAAFTGMVQTVPGPIGIGLGVAAAGAALTSGWQNVKKIYAVSEKSQSAPSASTPTLPTTTPITTDARSKSGTEQDIPIASGVVSRNMTQVNQQSQVAVIVDQVTANQMTQQNIINSSIL